MSTKAQRNDPCPCGSGKKYKNCCSVQQARSHWVATLAVCFFIVIAGFAVVSVVRDARRSPEVPEGFVWSEEHGHLHRVGADPHATYGAPPPAGSTWNDEHQHYHGPDGRQIQWSDSRDSWLDADGNPI